MSQVFSRCRKAEMTTYKAGRKRDSRSNFLKKVAYKTYIDTADTEPVLSNKKHITRVEITERVSENLLARK